MQITEGVYCSKNPIGSHLMSINCYLIVDHGQAFLFDTGWSKRISKQVIGVEPEREGMDVLMELFDEAGVDPHRLNGIIISHMHPDHAGLANELVDLSGAPLYTTEIDLLESTLLAERGPEQELRDLRWYYANGVDDVEAMNMVKGAPLYDDPPRRNYHFVNDGDIIPIGDMRWQVIWTPGHTWGHICLWEKSRNILLTGDHILGHDTPIIMCRPCLDGIRVNPLGGYLWSLHRLEQCGDALALPAHADTVTDLQSRLQILLHHHDQRYDDVFFSLNDGAKTAFEVACEIPWMGRRKKLMDMRRLLDRCLAFWETLAHLRSLEARQLITSTKRDGVWYWEQTGKEVMKYDGTDPRQWEKKIYSV